MLHLPPNPKFALIVVDMQQHFFRIPERRNGLDQVIARINQLIDAFDQRSYPIIHVVTAFAADQSDWDLKMRQTANPELIEGSVETKILPEIDVQKHHTIVRKTRYSAFFKTSLAEILHDLKVDSVVVVGAYTHYCVNATVFDAYCHDFVPGLVTDAVISHLIDESRLIIQRMQRNGYWLWTTDELIRQI